MIMYVSFINFSDCGRNRSNIFPKKCYKICSYFSEPIAGSASSQNVTMDFEIGESDFSALSEFLGPEVSSNKSFLLNRWY